MSTVFDATGLDFTHPGTLNPTLERQEGPRAAQLFFLLPQVCDAGCRFEL